MSVHNDWRRVFGHDYFDSLCRSCSSSFFICCHDVERRRAKTILVCWKKATHIPSGLLVSILIFLELLVVLGGWKYKDDVMSSDTLLINNEISNTHAIGSVMYTDYILYFQLSGVILLLSMIGAIVLTYRKRDNIKRQSYITQISREKITAVELKEVESGKGVKIND